MNRRGRGRTRRSKRGKEEIDKEGKERMRGETLTAGKRNRERER